MTSHSSSSIYWLNKDARKYLSRDYLLPGVTPEQRMRQIAERAEHLLAYPGFADRFESYLHRGWFSLASPIWSNFGAGRGLPISCNGSYVGDSVSQIMEKAGEIAMMTKLGAGTSAYFGDVRPRGAPIAGGGTSMGAVHFMQIFNTVISVISQASVRRGQCAIYLPVEHPDIMEFLNIKTEGNPIQELFTGVCIGDAWMHSLKAGDKEKLKVWRTILKRRRKEGPWIFFTDTVNRGAPQVYKDKGMKIHASQLCSEIALSSSPDESYVCNLSSMNLLHYDEWKDTDAVETLTYFLDAVMTEYIDLTKDIPEMKAAHRFASNQRALGIGVLGWHSCLQRRSIPFESMEAKMLNHQIHRLIQQKTLAASKEMAVRYGEPELLNGYGLRNVTTMTIAPTKSSAFILGQVSEGVQPIHSNYRVDELAKGVFTYRNPELQRVLAAQGHDDEVTWKSILARGGSVQHLDCLSAHDKEVYRTFAEISQKEVIIQAAARQQYIDQSQSLNLMIPAKVSDKEVSDLLVFAWESGVKTLYYQLAANPSQDLARSLMSCRSCEG